ncbi:antibiotic biosynthesis monooxygenase [Pendulispora rubella]|uniref:Antibiotic biosynthesis monooxygenase n=1 Tax=Pendulispora rubella TaxID=2741070 RepID=A0ABZ2L8Q8_9BACT
MRTVVPMSGLTRGINRSILGIAAAAALALTVPSGAVVWAQTSEIEQHHPENPGLTSIAFVHAIPGQEKELGRRLLALVAPTRREPGNINYDIHQSNDDPATWAVYENWRAQADLDAHFQTPYFLDFINHSGEVLTGPPDIRYFTMKSRQVPPKHPRPE